LIAGVTITAYARDAETNYLLNCEGCHKSDGSGQSGSVPDFRSSVARFLALPEGRAYLGRVPGTSQSLLSDPDRAAVLNWIVSSFDREHVPADFVFYTSEEMAVYRQEPLSNAGAERNRLLREIDSHPLTTTMASADSPVRPDSAAAAGQPPASATNAPRGFTLCAACHPTSADGASAMGPNLRGVVGRRAGALGGFAYSSAMRFSGIIWTPQELDSFLANVQQRVPGTIMTIPGVADVNERALLIQYLESLR